MEHGVETDPPTHTETDSHVHRNYRPNYNWQSTSNQRLNPRPSAFFFLVDSYISYPQKLAISGIDTLSLDPCIKTYTDAILQIKLICVDTVVTIAFYRIYRPMCMNFVHTCVWQPNKRWDEMHKLQLNSTQLNSTENYGRRCLTPLSPHRNYILS